MFMYELVQTHRVRRGLQELAAIGAVVSALSIMGVSNASPLAERQVAHSANASDTLRPCPEDLQTLPVSGNTTVMIPAVAGVNCVIDNPFIWQATQARQDHLITK